MPLTEIAPSQTQRPSRRKPDKVYGKRADRLKAYSANALFIDENEVAEQLAGMKITPKHEKLGNLESRTDQKPSSERKIRTKRTTAQRVSLHEDHTTKNVISGQLVPDRKPGIYPPVFKDQETEYVRGLFCEANSPSNHHLRMFDWFANTVGKGFSICKLAEGSYGECYAMKPLRSSTEAVLKEGCVVKILPINPRGRPNSSQWSRVAQLIQEVQIHKLLDGIPGFVRFKEVYVVQGKYPASFLEAFRNFSARPGVDAQFKDPEKQFNKNQKFAVFDLSDAGIDLENLKTPSAYQIFDIFWTLTILLTNAENNIEFEHRDLHVGNVCYKSRCTGGRIDVDSYDDRIMNAEPTVKLGLANLDITIIDHTLSRAALTSGQVAYNAMQDFQFDSQGDTEEEKLQHDTYRRMRDCVIRRHQLVQNTSPRNEEVTTDPWASFVPQTNVVWLMYTLAVLTRRANESVLKGSSDLSKGLQRKMFADFREILDRFALSELGVLPATSNELLNLGVQEGWLAEGDIEAFKAYSEEA